MPSEQISTLAFFKNFSYVVAFISTIEWLGFNPQAVAMLAILMFLDVFTGILCTLMIDGGRAITSAKLTMGVLKKLMLVFAILGIALAGKGVGLEMLSLVQGSISVLILGELYSILGNVHSARIGERKVEFDAVSFLLDKVKDLITKVLKV